MKIMLYPHVGSNNHGCEAIVRTTCDIIKKISKDVNIKLYSTDINSDYFWKLNDKLMINNQKSKIRRKSLDYFKAQFNYRILRNKDAFEKLTYKNVINQADGNTLALIIGGDTYCYSRPGHIYFMNKYVRNKKTKTILWGCSLEKKLFNAEMIDDLKKYDAIIARESITYNNVCSINPNTFLVPDPAFILEPSECSMPKKWRDGKMIGINISPLIISEGKDKQTVINNYLNLISWIISNTECVIALIPHVCVSTNNDCKAIEIIKNYFPNNDRVIEIEEHNCENMKYIISKCEFIICSRTHVSIAAYSSCVPTLVVGYSVKAQGIARDIFKDEKDYVLPIKLTNSDDALINKFMNLWNKRNEIRQYLKDFMPEYVERVTNYNNILEKFL